MLRKMTKRETNSLVWKEKVAIKESQNTIYSRGYHISLFDDTKSKEAE